MKFQVRKNPESPLNPCENLKVTQTTPILSIMLRLPVPQKFISENKIQISGVQTMFTATSALKRDRRAVLGMVCVFIPQIGTILTHSNMCETQREYLATAGRRPRGSLRRL